MSKIVALVPAAGIGSRLAAGIPKAFYNVTINGRRAPIVCHTIDRLCELSEIYQIYLALPPHMQAAEINFGQRVKIIAGGASRQETVRRLVEAAANLKPDIALVHDGARPYVSVELIRAAIVEAEKFGAVTAGIPISDTIVDFNASTRQITSYYNRESLSALQTPQAFKFSLLHKAHESSANTTSTDDAALVMRIQPVKIIPGELSNIKITYPEDLT